MLDVDCGDGRRLTALVLEEQLAWMSEAGLVQVDCNQRWRGFALVVGQAPR